MAKYSVGDYEIGDEVMISPDNDNENYDSFRGKKLIIIDKVTSSEEHPAFDSALEGQGLYSFETEDGGDVPFSLYDYELVAYYERGGKVVRYSDGRKRRLDTWNSGRSWTMDRKYYNKNEDWEIPMNERKTKGKQEVSFLTGEPIKEEPKQEEKKEEKVETSFLSGEPTEIKEEKKEEKVETSFLSGEPKEEEGEGITGLAERGGKIVRYRDGRKRRLDTWNSGRSWTMDRKYYNKNEDWEIPMDKRSSKSFLSGETKTENKDEKSFLSGEPTEVKKDDTNWSWLGFEDGGMMKSQKGNYYAEGGNIFDEDAKRIINDKAIELMKENISYQWRNSDMGSGWEFTLYAPNGKDVLDEKYYIDFYEGEGEEDDEDLDEWQNFGSGKSSEEMRKYYYKQWKEDMYEMYLEKFIEDNKDNLDWFIEGKYKYGIFTVSEDGEELGDIFFSDNPDLEFDPYGDDVPVSVGSNQMVKRLEEEYSKGGKVGKRRVKDYKYVPNYMIESVTVAKGKKETEIDGGNILDGLYVKGRVKFEEGGWADKGMDYGSDLTDEAMVKNNLMNGEISCETLTQIIGCKPNYPNQIVGSIKLEKCFLRPYYKLA